MTPGHLWLFTRRASAALTLAAVAACRSQPNENAEPKRDTWGRQLAAEFARQPEPAPAKWYPLIGEYGPDTTLRWYVLERDRRLNILDQQGNYVPLSET